MLFQPENTAMMPLESMKIGDFGKLQERYQAMTLAKRAEAVLADAAPALSTAEIILGGIAAQKKNRQVFEAMRANALLVGKMRPSEAKNMLLDASCDFIDITRKKLAAWRKTMERLAQGEGIIASDAREYIPSHAPLALAISGVSTVSNYLSIVQLALSDMAAADGKNAGRYISQLATIRRCATVLSDCEHASAFTAMVH